MQTARPADAPVVNRVRRGGGNLRRLADGDKHLVRHCGIPARTRSTASPPSPSGVAMAAMVSEAWVQHKGANRRALHSTCRVVEEAVNFGHFTSPQSHNSAGTTQPNARHQQVRLRHTFRLASFCFGCEIAGCDEDALVGAAQHRVAKLTDLSPTDGPFVSLHWNGTLGTTNAFSRALRYHQCLGRDCVVTTSFRSRIRGVIACRVARTLTRGGLGELLAPLLRFPLNLVLVRSLFR